VDRHSSADVEKKTLRCFASVRWLCIDGLETVNYYLDINVVLEKDGEDQLDRSCEK
jgi:hypothetical protein